MSGSYPSIITINKNRNAHLRRLLEGLGRGIPPAEIIVVEMGDCHPQMDHIIQVPLACDGLPLARARNTGRFAAKGNVLIFLDVDCIPSMDLVSALTASVLTHKAVICCEIFYLSAAVADGWTEAGLSTNSVPHPARKFPRTGVLKAQNPGLFWSLAFGIPATLYDRLGGFDEAFSGYGAEDTDLAFRADAMGIPILFTAEGHAFHQRHAACDPPLTHFVDIVRNAALFRRRHGIWPMRDWLDAFERLGLVRILDDQIHMLREPTAKEIVAATVPPDRPF